MLFVTNGILSLFLLPVAVYEYQTILQLGLYAWMVIIFTCVLWAANGFLGNYSYKVAPISVREPLSQTQIIFAVFIGLIVFGETLYFFDYIGISLIVLAGLVLAFGRGVDKKDVNMWVVGSVLLMALITAITSAFDKYTVSFLQPHVYLFFNFFIGNLALFFVMTKERFLEIKKVCSDVVTLRQMFLLSFLFSASFYFTLVAYKNFDFSLVYPILKVSAPITAFAGILFLGERNGWKIKVVAVLLAFLGAVFIKVF